MNFLKTVLVSVVVAVIVFVAGWLVVSPSSANSTLGASFANVQSTVWQFTGGISLDPGGSNGNGGDVLITKGGTMAAGQNTACYTNKTGRTQFFDYADVALTGGYASSSMRLSVISTTTPCTSLVASQYYAAPTPTASSTFLIDNDLIPTSTPPNYVINADVNGGTNATGTVPVLDGSSVLILLRTDRLTNTCTGAGSGTGACETSTSTNRGFNLNWFLEGHYRP